MKFLAPALLLLTLTQGCTFITRAICGDGVVDLNKDEECDDANKTDSDGCDKECLVEDGFICPTPGDGCIESCGNDIIDGEFGEVCDDGNSRDGDGCSANCDEIEDGFACPIQGEDCVKICGNGVLDPDEECDPPGDNCNAQCQIVCDANADCDDSDACTTDICDIPTGVCSNEAPNIADANECNLEECDPSTGIVTSTAVDDQTICEDDNNNTDTRDICVGGLCVRSTCGDGFADLGVEECDDGALNTEEEDGCTTQCKSGPVCNFGDERETDPTTGHCYALFDDVRNWPFAEALCVGEGGHLASIENALVQNIVENLANGNDVWIGFNDRAVEGTFAWTDGSPDTFDNFTGQEPNNDGTFGEDCTSFESNATWNDENCDSTLHTLVCEFQ